MRLNTDPTPAAPDFSDCDPQEEALLLEEVQATLVACPLTTIQNAVATGRHIYKQDWRQEARKLCHQLGLPTCSTSLMGIVR